jgi:hypothetical protein
MVRLVEAITSLTHRLGTNRNTNINVAFCDLVCNVLCGLESGGAESIARGCTGSIGDAGGERGGTHNICCFSVVDL